MDDTIKFLSISRRTWYRWKERNLGPRWAYVALSVMSGELDKLGWKGFFIEDGVLYSRELSRNYYNWKPADLMVTVFCNCNSHVYLREQRKNKIVNNEKIMNINTYRRQKIN